MKKQLIAVAMAVLLIGCSSLPRYVITLTETMKSAANEYATIYNQGLVSAEIHAKVQMAHLKYRESAGVAAEALKSYQLSRDNTQYLAAFAAAQQAANGFITLISPLILPAKATQLKNNVTKASMP